MSHCWRMKSVGLTRQTDLSVAVKKIRWNPEMIVSILGGVSCLPGFLPLWS